ncbi:hypothetical protein [Psychrobacter sp. CAL346-MNA-CIBAN-0220]|uniref:hypothetical protein n=1 Tax=Psychrobacter sp. CAL346-MNA-CIBAN-0220 TaxID=3140457 RepID=UPI003317538F
MPTKKRRVALTVDDDLNKLLEDLSVLMKKPKSSIITELLVDVTPMLIDLKNALELAEQKKDIKSTLARMTVLANTQALEMNNDVLNQFSLLESQDD